MGDLKSCPFCGGTPSPTGRVTYSENHEAWWPDGERVREAFFVNCTRCGASNLGLIGHRTPEAAIEAWNRRVSAAPDGWVLVPREPTGKMTSLGALAVRTGALHLTVLEAAAIYRAMVSAAPVLGEDKGGASQGSLEPGAKTAACQPEGSASADGAAFPAPLPVDLAPRDGTMLRLLVDYSEAANAAEIAQMNADGYLWPHTPLEDTADTAWTIGFNSLENTGEDTWQFVGWSWSQDCYVEGRGKVVGWLPLHGEQA